MFFENLLIESTKMAHLIVLRIDIDQRAKRAINLTNI